jgi:aerobic carbon-monoxide dehydrogenase large subunit
MTKFGLAQSIRRVEDPRLLLGRGRYTDDILLPGMLHGIVLRSPHAAAKINRIDTKAAASVEGVKAIYTGADFKADGIGPMPCAAPVQNRDGSNMGIHRIPHWSKTQCVMSAIRWRSSSPTRRRPRAMRQN